MNPLHNTFYNTFIDHVSDMVFVMKVTEDDHIVYEHLNQVAQKKTGFTTDLIGKTIQEVNTEGTANLLQKRYEDTLHSESVNTFQDMYITQGNKLMYTHTTVIPSINEQENGTYIIAIVKDRTKNVEITQKLEESKEHFQIIVENVADLVVSINSERKITFTSPSYNKVLGLNNEQVIGRLYTHNIHPDDLAIVNDNLTRAIIKGEPFKVEFRQSNHVKQWIWSEAHGVPVLDEHDTFKHMVIVTRNINKRKEYQAKLKYFAMHDPLTNLPNRRHFNEQLASAIQHNHDNPSGLALLLLDIDRFKSINDHYGHNIGDKVIQEFGRRLQAISNNKSVVARLGGDEFVILLPNRTSIDATINLAETIIEETKKPWDIDGNNPVITTSIGIGMVNGTSNISENLIMKTADIALYEAKRSGKNTYKINFCMSETS